MTDNLLAQVPLLLPELEVAYRDLHSHPELSGQEKRTAAIAASSLRSAGFDVTEDVGGHGVVGVMRNGAGPVVWLRADMDALPIEEDTGLGYASTVTAEDRNGNIVPVAHACGHDMHVACLMGAAAVLGSSRRDWNGTLVLIFQPAEELVDGARRMIDDGILDRFPRPDVVLGQHVGPLPAGTAWYMPEATLAASDNFEIRLFGQGGHGSRPETTIDPIVMAASLIMKLQTIVSREVPPNAAAVVTVGSVVAGIADNIIPDEALLKLTIRSFDPTSRDRILTSMERITRAEALASNAPREPEITRTFSSPVTYNDPGTTARVAAAFDAAWGPMQAFRQPQPGTGSEDFGEFGNAAGVPSVFWFFGGADPALFAGAADPIKVFQSIPSNHSPQYAPVIEPTLQTGIEALLIAAMSWLRPQANA